MANYPAWPGRPHSQTYQHKSPLDNGEIFLYSRSWLVGQRNRCWIKGLGKNPQHEWARSLFAVPFVRGLPSMTRVQISKIMPQNVYTRPPFYSWEKFCVYTRILSYDLLVVPRLYLVLQPCFGLFQGCI